MVGEGPGHRRDTEYLLRETEIGPVLQDTGARFVDLNLDDVSRIPLLGRFGSLGSLYLPDTLLGADLLVSMPKLKTHRGAAKRFKRTGSGKLKRGHAYKRHLTGKKSQDRIRSLRKPTLVSGADHKRVERLLND